MSDQKRDSPVRYTGGQVVMIVLGTIMLAPGVCALVYVVGGTWDIISKGQSFDWRDPLAQMIMAVWAISFAIAAVGVALIVVARRRARVSC
jgi:hypothetical protein